MFRVEALYPEYLTDLNVLVCPSAPSGSTALELWDEGTTLSSLYHEALVRGGYPRTGDGIVEPCEVYEHPYVYLGWAIDNALARNEINLATGANRLGELNANVEALFESLNMSSPEDAVAMTEGDWDVADGTGTGGGSTIYRLREGIERFLITDINNPAGSAQAQSTLSVFWDEISGDEASHFNHVPGGCNVLYMDGHVSFIRYVAPDGPISP